MNRILIVDDEPNIREIVGAYLKKEGYEILLAKDGLEALTICENQAIDLMVLDRMLPKLSGEQVLKKVRAFSQVPVIMLTAKVSDDDVVDGFMGGADDYIKKPFSPRELVVRVHAMLRRQKSQEDNSTLYRFRNDDLIVDIDKVEVRKCGENVLITPHEFKILVMMIENAGMVLSREQIIDKTFGLHFDGYDRTIDTHIKNIRQKIEDNPKQPTYIKTIYAMGYRFLSEE